MGSLLDMDLGGGSNTATSSGGWNNWGGNSATKDFVAPDYSDCLPGTQPG